MIMTCCLDFLMNQKYRFNYPLTLQLYDLSWDQSLRSHFIPSLPVQYRKQCLRLVSLSPDI